MWRNSFLRELWPTVCNFSKKLFHMHFPEHCIARTLIFQNVTRCATQDFWWQGRFLGIGALRWTFGKESAFWCFNPNNLEFFFENQGTFLQNQGIFLAKSGHLSCNRVGDNSPVPPSFLPGDFGGYFFY